MSDQFWQMSEQILLCADIIMSEHFSVLISCFVFVAMCEVNCIVYTCRCTYVHMYVSNVTIVIMDNFECTV